MEKAWEFAVVSEKESDNESVLLDAEFHADYFIFDTIRKRRRKLFLSTIIYMIFAAIGISLISFASGQKTTIEIFSFLFDAEGNFRWLLIIGLVTSTVALIGFFISALGFTSSVASSTREIVDKNHTSKLALDAGINTMSAEELSEMEKRGERSQKEQAFNDARRIAIKNTSDLRDQNHKITSSWKDVLVASRLRLIGNADRLAARSKANLITGVGFALLSVVTLILVILFPSQANEEFSIIETIVQALPRYTLVLLFQALSFFFLRNFLKTESAYRENKNEITNIELKLTAGLFSEADGQNYETLLSAFAKDDRNKSNYINKDGEPNLGSTTLTELVGLIKVLKDV